MSLHDSPYPRRHRGYHLLRQLDVAPDDEERAYADFSIVSPGPDTPAGAIPASWRPFPSVGAERLYVSPSRDERALPARFVQPLVCQRRGRSTPGVGFIGVDSRTWTDARHEAPPPPPRPRPGPWEEKREGGAFRPRLSVEELLEACGLDAPRGPARVWDGRPGEPVRVAVIDMECGGWSVLPGFDPECLRLTPVGGGLDFPRSHRRPDAVQRMPGHGVVMAAAVAAVAPGVRLGLFEIPLAHHPHLYATDLAAALARAVGEWRADVVLVAMASAGWGTPPHLRAILRACAREGRAGRGTAIVCCTGRLSQNLDIHGDSPVLAGDDFNAQPWVIPVTACSLEGGWYRVRGTPVGRLGPSVELCAPGDLVTFPSAGAADDSSLAAAVVAGLAARMVATHPGLGLMDLRLLLRMTARPLPAEDAPAVPELESDRFNEWDGAGHNLKLGYGRVHAAGACLAAADPLCQALLAAQPSASTWPGPRDALDAARHWDARLRELAQRHVLARRYLELRGHFVPWVLRDPELRDGLLWLARHLRALWRYGPRCWPEDGTDHGVLLDRLHLVLERLDALREHAPPELPRKEMAEWLRALSSHLANLSAHSVARFMAWGLMPPGAGCG